MVHNMYSLKARYAVGSVAIGLCLAVFCVARIFDSYSSLAFGAAVCLLPVSILSLIACLSPRREASDEMYETHDGQAAGHTLRIILIAAGIVCAISIVTNIKVDLATASLGLMSFGLLIYGIVFGWLER